ncbi:MAG: formate dehydrogenase subunit gamma [Rhodobacteraceae bacterium]|nr:formate dehydrogenase subunit gamma [Paracoccaceae bacterium]
MLRILLAISLIFGLAVSAGAQDSTTATDSMDRSSTGGATTLEDILRRQEGLQVDPEYRRSNTGSADAAADITQQLGTLGGASESDVFRALRYGTADISVTSRSPAAGTIIQDGGIWWLQAREGWLATYGAYLLGGTLVLLTMFYVLRGKIRIEGQSGVSTILRFTTFERFGHWLFAGSFLILGLTGLLTLFGRKVVIPLLGHDAFSTIAIASKWVHNNISWAFMLGLIIITVNWIAHNIPNRLDLVWLSKAGGLFSKGVHPPARKFNAGQKMIFWGCVVLGVSISASGLSLLFPFELPMFAKTFAVLNSTGLPQLVGLGTLPEVMAPQEEMQYAQLWHSIVAFVFMAMIFAHIYIGSVGMEGAIDAMTTGEVDTQWAKEHHSLWVAEVEEADRAAAAKAGQVSPAE